MSVRPFASSVIWAVNIVLALILIDAALAQIGPEDIQFPVAELGNCQSEVECRSYCEKPKNTKVCLDFAEKHNLISEEELAKARKFFEVGKGPGGCTTEESCKSYCDDVSHIDECIAFAEENDFLPPEELEEAKKVQTALAQGAQLPGNCRSKTECDNYCGDSAHMEECIAFAEAAGFIPADELEEAKKVLEAVRKGAKPPPCRGRAQCDAYCGEPEHFEECISFAEAAGFVSSEEAAMARKTGGQGPAGCRGREECDRFCQDENNLEVCLAFAKEHGLISEKDAEMARKTGGKGPGGCRGREECEDFCEDPTNQEICFNFAKEHGLIPEEDLRAMEQGRTRMMEGLSQAPPEVMACLTDTLGSETLEGIKSGTIMPRRDIGDKMRECFEKMRGAGMARPGARPGGPPGVNVSVKTGPLGFDVIFRAPDGIQSFSIQPQAGSSYGGDLPGCPKEFKAETPFGAGSLPLGVAITDCSGNRHEFQVSGQGEYRKAGEEGGSPGGFPGFEGGPPPGFEGGTPPGFSGPGGCQGPEECKAYCQANPQECQGFGPGSGGGEPGQPPREQICLQVLTPARDPQTGKCVVFSNSCIPPGWIPVERGSQEAEECKEQESMPPQGTMPREGMMPPSQEEIREMMEQQIKEQTQQQIQQIQQQMPSLMPPEGMIAPPTEAISPPTETTLPPTETMSPPPSTQRPLQFLLGTLLAPFIDLLNQ